jgi:uncharacterized protein YjbJ (UPF0337 family)
VGFSNKQQPLPQNAIRQIIAITHTPMGATDKVKNAAQDFAGKAKEQAGKVTGDKDTEGEGKKDQTKSSVKKAGENVKDAFK